ncbi:glycosyltransferase family 39 protein [Actinomadura verrucosospora]|uniref:4-amino-4-deoxy-L-arabinose transferase-like protein n=1 Tax=Actinomadura verrucosospora TaxID=46165 RepID=A0A7D3ZIV3_ACTVE|nr:glycosyltransferase family 39 protein [Actinomadura verrucosospora]QKG19282.1 4-amino-4-deoxy-L-arabinose transferase-like protein [Actinomadura verrucosospora]
MAQTIPAPAARTAAPQRRGRIRRILLGAPGDPRWSRPALWAVLAVAAALYAWDLTSGGYANSYYSAAVKSGTQSWKAFFFGSLDAGNYITVDKPPMALWAQELLARVIGFGTPALLLPQVAEGVAAVAILHATVRRAFGHPAALIAAAVLALTPITVAIDRDNNPDTLLVLLLVAAAWACQRAVETGRLRPLLLSAFLVGCGFNTKMLQAFLVVPAFALVYLIAARPPIVRRLLHLVAAGAALAVSSAWWMLIVDAVPASSRPYIGGSTDGTVWDLVIGYNGLGRVFGENNGPGGGRGGPGGGGASFGGQAGAGRLFNDIVGGQISWLIPFAVIALAACLLLLWKRPRTDLARAALLLWGGWLAVHYVIFSFAEGTFHPYYTTALGPAIAALTGAGAVLLHAAGRRDGRLSRVWPLVLAAAIAVTGAWAFTLLNRTPSWHPWLRWTIAAAAVLAVAGLLLGRFVRRAGTRAAVAGTVFAVVAALAGPGAYAVSAASTASNGTNPQAGPSTGFGGPGGMRAMRGMPGGTKGAFPGGQMPGGAPGGQMPEGFPGFPGGAPGGQGSAGQGQDARSGGGQTPWTLGDRSQRPGGARGGFGGPGGPGGEADTKMISYLERNQGNATWLLAVSSAQSASSIILSTGRPVIAIGGFTGSDPAMTVAKLQQYVKDGKLRYILLGGGMGPGGGNASVTAWVQKNGTLVKPAEYGGTSSSGSTGAQLYKLG